METQKPWWKSRAIWAGIVTVLMGTYEMVRVHLLPGLPEVPGVLLAILGALGIYGRAAATGKVTR